jgi:hypothetical protein
VDEARWVDDFAEAWAREHGGSANTSGLILIILLARLSVLIEGFQATVLKPLDLNPSDYAVLSALRRSGSPYELAPHELYTALGISSGGMTKMIKRLENLGLVTRIDDLDVCGEREAGPEQFDDSRAGPVVSHERVPHSEHQRLDRLGHARLLFSPSGAVVGRFWEV